MDVGGKVGASGIFAVDIQVADVRHDGIARDVDCRVRRAVAGVSIHQDIRAADVERPARHGESRCRPLAICQLQISGQSHRTAALKIVPVAGNSRIRKIKAVGGNIAVCHFKSVVCDVESAGDCAVAGEGDGSFGGEVCNFGGGDGVGNRTGAGDGTTSDVQRTRTDRRDSVVIRPGIDKRAARKSRTAGVGVGRIERDSARPRDLNRGLARVEGKDIRGRPARRRKRHRRGAHSQLQCGYRKNHGKGFAEQTRVHPVQAGLSAVFHHHKFSFQPLTYAF